MRYYLGEIYISHRKTWFGYIPADHMFNSVLIEANDFFEAKCKCTNWANEYMKPYGDKFKFTSLVTAPI
jgi:hypothetical protein